MEIIFETVTLQEQILRILMAVMLTVCGYQLYELGKAKGKLELRKEDIKKIDAKLKKLRGY